MILPIVAYGDPVLRKVCDTIPEDYSVFDKFIEDMFQTMYHSNGVGLAAPQVGQAIRLFVVDTVGFSENEDLTPEEQAYLKTFKKAFINANYEVQVHAPWQGYPTDDVQADTRSRSEERRVGKECRSRWSPYH